MSLPKGQVAKAQLEALQREVSRRRLMPFVKRFNPKYKDGWVHNDICRRLERFSQAVAEGKSPRLMLLMPPRHGKSELASRNFPAWHLGQYPDHEFIACSYNLSLAMDFSRKVKGLMSDPLYAPVFATRLDANNQSTESWGVAGHRGGYVAAGIGGPITGKGAHCLVIDDPCVSAGSRVRTRRGLVPIEEVVVGDEVFTHMSRWRKVTATYDNGVKEVMTLCVGEYKISVTPEHLLYTSIGWVAAADAKDVYGEELSAVWGGVRRPVEDPEVLQQRMPGGQSAHPAKDLPAVRHRVPAAQGQRDQVLQSGLSARGASCSEAQGVQALPPGVRGCSQHVEILRGFVQEGARQGSDDVRAQGASAPGSAPSGALERPACPGFATQTLQRVRDGLLAVAHLPAVLLARVQERRALKEDEGQGQPQFPARDGRGLLQPCVQEGAEQASPGAVRGLLPVRADELVTRAPSGRDEDEQRAGQPGMSVRLVPHPVSQAARSGTARVYDLTVEEDHSFVAEGLVVHNCKNAEEADSPDIREKIWEWYLSTAYSRLAPGGGVLIIQCMTGDTPVRLPDGTEKRLDAIRAGDEVATFDDGRLGVSTVAAWKSNGRDSVYTITMNSGKMVRANGRHPFLVSVAGELKWIRTKHLTTDHTIVVLQDSAASGSEKPVQQTDATSQQSAGASAPPTTTSKNGQTDTALHLSTLSHAALRTSSIATASRLTRTLNSWLRKAAGALSAGVSRMTGRPGTGAENSASTTTTTQVRSGGCCATTATPPQGTPAQSASPSRWLSTSEFTTDAVRSVELTGEEEVFDVQIDRTENFIANGLVSHNTWWHDDDLAGRLQTLMKTVGVDDEYIDQFEVIKYPALAESDEWLNEDTDLIEYDLPESEATAVGAPYTLLRRKGDALHPDRYDVDKLLRIKAQNKGGRWWSALYQQNPVPDDGGYFTKDQFRTSELPSLKMSNVYIAWDFAISEKKQNDYTVGTVLLHDHDDVLHVADQIRFKSGDAFYIVEAILNLASKWHNPSLVLGVEDGQIYRAIEALLKKRMRERSFYPSVQVLKPITDKLARARALQGRMQQGMVSFKRGAPWYDSLRTEMLRFPAGAHDDQVDSLSWATQLAVGREAPRRPTENRMKSWKDKLTTDGTLSHMVA